MVDQQDNISLWNTAAERIFGYTPEEAIGQELHSLIAPQRYHQAFQQAFGQVKTTKRGALIGQMVELTAMRRDGTEFPVELSLSSVKLKGNWNGMAIIRDITERKAAEESLRKLSRAVEQTASMIVITDRHGTIE